MLGHVVRAMRLSHVSCSFVSSLCLPSWSNFVPNEAVRCVSLISRSNVMKYCVFTFYVQVLSTEGAYSTQGSGSCRWGHAAVTVGGARVPDFATLVCDTYDELGNT